MGIDIVSYRIRIGSFYRKWKGRNHETKSDTCAILYLFFGIIVMALLLISGLESNPGPSNDELMSFLKEMKNEMMNGQERNSKDFSSLAADVNNRFKEINEKVEELNARHIRNVKELSEMKAAMRRWDFEDRCNNIVIFGVEEGRNERNWDACIAALDTFNYYMSINISEDQVKNAYRLGRGANRPIMVKFVSRFTKEYIMAEAHKLKGSRIYLSNDYDEETRRLRKQLIPYLKEARRNGFKAMLRGNKLYVDGNNYDLEYCMKVYPYVGIVQDQGRSRSLSPTVSMQRHFQPGGMGRNMSTAEFQRSRNEKQSGVAGAVASCTNEDKSANPDKLEPTNVNLTMNDERLQRGNDGNGAVERRSGGAQRTANSPESEVVMMRSESRRRENSGNDSPRLQFIRSSDDQREVSAGREPFERQEGARNRKSRSLSPSGNEVRDWGPEQDHTRKTSASQGNKNNFSWDAPVHNYDLRRYYPKVPSSSKGHSNDNLL